MPAQKRTSHDYHRISVRPLSGALGAEIHGVDLSDALSDEVFAEIHRAFLENLVIFFRDQRVDPAALKAFAVRFGPLDIHSILKPLDGNPEVLPVFTEATARHVYAEGWHADVTYQEEPTLGAVLYALDVPDVGGDTLFSNRDSDGERARSPCGTTDAPFIARSATTSVTGVTCIACP